MSFSSWQKMKNWKLPTVTKNVRERKLRLLFVRGQTYKFSGEQSEKCIII